MREFVCVRSVAAVSGNWEMVLTFAANRLANGLLVLTALAYADLNGEPRNEHGTFASLIGGKLFSCQ